jgi:MFS family permease
MTAANLRAGKAQAYTLIALGTLPTLAIAGLVAVLPALFAQFKDVPHRELLVPMVLTVPSLCVALFSSVIGAAADRWGRRRLLLLALLCFSLFGLAPLLFDDLYAIIASRFIVGLAEAAILTIGNALMGDYFDGEERKRWLGLQMSLGPFVASGFIVAGGLLGSVSWHGPFALYLLGLAVFAVVWFTIYEPPAPSHSESAARAAATHFPWRATWLVGSVTLLVSIIYFVQAVQHGRIFGDLGVSTPARISVIVTIASMGTVIGGMTYRYMRLRPIGWMLALVFACYGIGYLGVSLSPDYLVGIPFDGLGQFAGGFGLPLLIAWALTKYDYEHRGRGMGVWAACFFLGQFLSPPVMTLIGHGRLSFLASVGVLGVISLLCAVVAWFAGRTRAPQLAPQ